MTDTAPSNDLYYLITLRNGTTKILSIKQFQAVYGVADHRFELRLEQLRYFYPDAIHWDMVKWIEGSWKV